MKHLTRRPGQLVAPAREPTSLQITHTRMLTSPLKWIELLLTSWILRCSPLKGLYELKSNERKMRWKGKEKGRPWLEVILFPNSIG